MRRCMPAAERKAMGIQTVQEAQGAYDGRYEHELQRLCEQELSRRGMVFLHLRTKQQAAACPGLPDLVIFPGNGFVLFVELKSFTGKLEEDQVKMHTKLAACGYYVAIARTFDRFVELLENAANDKYGEG
jgi:hypothetical protein